jgi:hypothetical protein
MSRRAAAWIAWPLSGVSALLGGLYLLLLALSSATTGASIDPYWGAGVVVAVLFPAAGLVEGAFDEVRWAARTVPALV